MRTRSPDRQVGPDYNRNQRQKNNQQKQVTNYAPIDSELLNSTSNGQIGAWYNELNVETETISSEKSDTVSESSPNVYYIFDKNAIIRSAENNFTSTGSKIPQWSAVKVIETSANGKYIKVESVADSTQVWWTSKSNAVKSITSSDSANYKVLYNDVDLLTAPGEKEGNDKLEDNCDYQILQSFTSTEGDYAQIKYSDGQESLGWIKDASANLATGAAISRRDTMEKLKKYLEDQLETAKSKTGADKISFVQGMLYQIEQFSENIAKDPPVYPVIANLDRNPSFSEADDTAKGTFVPHELTGIVRGFIEITEFKPVEEVDTVSEEPTAVVEANQNESISPSRENNPQQLEARLAGDLNAPTLDQTAAEEPQRTVGGSRHSNIDWNSRLGVPQYRTQSDNLSIPEATCNVTAMAMTLEKLGNSRSDVITAIEAKLVEGVEHPNLVNLWETKAEAYFMAITTAAGTTNYRKLRGGTNGGLVGKENDLAKIFKDHGQMEDLIDFYLYLREGSTAKRTSIFTSKLREAIPEEINHIKFQGGGAFSPKIIKLDGENDSGKKKPPLPFSAKEKGKIKDTLDKGGAVVLSIRHKGLETSSHIVSVQSITSEGLIVGDPYGRHAEDYRYGELGDLYKGKDQSVSRVKYKNKSIYNENEADLTKRDFTAVAAQNLEENESRGKNQLMKWEMFNKSKKHLFVFFVKYIVLYEKN
ncbi:hypothetical protein [Persicobacter psychrovividus]|uniref:Peptidase C39-like domain-containing protein n=1 Tax=Persicobacter psychrovividus TaxID=387638 RepID=A0ABM7VJV5_9BACT|nr:hypothetical protein PEPS_35630 [Persicobacter psychrovividus]